MIRRPLTSPFFFFNDTATTEIYTLSLHDALPIFNGARDVHEEHIVVALDESNLVGALLENGLHARAEAVPGGVFLIDFKLAVRSEEHTSELQSQSNLVCRLLLEKKKKRHLPDPPHNDNPRYLCADQQRSHSAPRSLHSCTLKVDNGSTNV